METILTALKISLICTAVFAAAWEQMIFAKPAKWIEIKVKYKWILKPIFKCLICMSSFWTAFYWLVFGGFNLIIMILLVGGINVIITAIIAPIIPNEKFD